MPFFLHRGQAEVKILFFRQLFKMAINLQTLGMFRTETDIDTLDSGLAKYNVFIVRG